MISNLELFEHFTYFDWLVHKFNYYLNSQEKGQLDSSRGQGRIISLLIEEDGLSTKDLSERTGFSVSSLNEMLAKLEKKDLIKRTPLESDKRVILNCLTKKALECRPKLNLSFFDCLNNSERDELVELLNKLSCNLESRIDSFNNPELINSCLRRKNAAKAILNYKNKDFRRRL